MSNQTVQATNSASHSEESLPLKKRNVGVIKPSYESSDDLLSLPKDKKTKLVLFQHKAYFNVLKAFSAESSGISSERILIVKDLKDEWNIPIKTHTDYEEIIKKDSVVQKLRNISMASGEKNKQKVITAVEGNPLLLHIKTPKKADIDIAAAKMQNGNGVASAKMHDGNGVASAKMLNGNGVASATMQNGNGVASATMQNGNGVASKKMLNGNGVAPAKMHKGNGVVSAKMLNGNGVASATMQNGNGVASAKMHNGNGEASATIEDGKVIAPAKIEDGKVIAPAKIDYGKVIAPAKIEDGKVIASAKVQEEKKKSCSIFDDSPAPSWGQVSPESLTGKWVRIRLPGENVYITFFIKLYDSKTETHYLETALSQKNMEDPCNWVDIRHIPAEDIIWPEGNPGLPERKCFLKPGQTLLQETSTARQKTHVREVGKTSTGIPIIKRLDKGKAIVDG